LAVRQVPRCVPFLASYQVVPVLVDLIQRY
jgi:hypothetical protein